MKVLRECPNESIVGGPINGSLAQKYCDAVVSVRLYQRSFLGTGFDVDRITHKTNLD